MELAQGTHPQILLATVMQRTQPQTFHPINLILRGPYLLRIATQKQLTIHLTALVARGQVKHQLQRKLDKIFNCYQMRASPYCDSLAQILILSMS